MAAKLLTQIYAMVGIFLSHVDTHDRIISLKRRDWTQKLA